MKAAFMNKKIKELKKKFEIAYSGGPWYGDSMKDILNEINPAIVFEKVNGKSHSIAELTAHIIGWREFTLSRLEGNNNFKINQKETFNWKRIDEGEKTAWKNILKELDKNQKKIISTLNRLDDDFLNNKVAGRRYRAEFMLEGTIQHDIYHLGQIVVLKKLLS